jgi:hypothetical protein
MTVYVTILKNQFPYKKNTEVGVTQAEAERLVDNGIATYRDRRSSEGTTGNPKEDEAERTPKASKKSAKTNA